MHLKVYILLISGLLLLLPSSIKAQFNTPIGDKALSELSILTYLKSYQIQPGQSYTFTLFKPARGFPPWEEARPQVTWSVEPQKGARIDPITGEFKVDKSTSGGSIFEVKADVENGRRVLSTKVHVYTRESHPLVSIWKQKAIVLCSSGKVIIPDDAIRELIFWADGTFSVTWQPFEVYRDYWGSYTYGKKNGKIKFIVEAGNNIPADIDGEGYFTLTKEGELILKGVWLGSKKEEVKPAVCSMTWTASLNETKS